MNEDFWDACAEGNCAAARELRRQAAGTGKEIDPNWQNLWCSSASCLHVACTRDHLGVVDYLLTTFPALDPNLQNAFGRTPLRQACKRGHVEVARRLLQDQRVDPPDEDCLLMAVCRKHVGMIRFLLARKDLVLTEAGSEKILQAAAADDRRGALPALLSDPRFDPNATFSSCPVLHHAIVGYDLEAAWDLLQHPRIDPDRLAESGQHAIDLLHPSHCSWPSLSRRVLNALLVRCRPECARQPLTLLVAEREPLLARYLVAPRHVRKELRSTPSTAAQVFCLLLLLLENHVVAWDRHHQK